MPRNTLRRLLDCSDIPQVISIFDHWNACGRPLIWNIVKSHLKENKIIHYLCYDINPTILKSPPQAEAIPNINNMHLYDLHSDPLGWMGDSQIQPVTSSFSDLLRLSLEPGEANFVVVIDKINSASKYFCETELLRNIQRLKNNKSILQIILLCSEDTSSPGLVTSLDRISSASVKLRPTIGHSSCDITVKTRGGKIIRASEEFEFSENLSLLHSRPFLSTKIDKIDPEELGVDAPDDDMQTTFKLSLTEDEKVARSRLVLPHTRIQNSGGQIHYIPDAADDWDDEDPDDDLEI